ncbi:MAG: hypothetical protein LBT44_05025 [Clostridiales bacterium]|jgi:hypothetical protein|nr:hypothetical protein [Clostridiales bacterium]
MHGGHIKISLSILILTLFLALPACAAPISAPKTDAPSQSNQPVEAAFESAAPESSGGSNINIDGEELGGLSGDSLLYIGYWHSTNQSDADFAERFALDGEGTFIYACSEADASKRERYKTGTWSVSDGALRLLAEVRYVKSNQSDGAALQEEVCSPPEQETYTIARAGSDPETGRAVITIDGTTFYNFDNQEDFLVEFYEMLN